LLTGRPELCHFSDSVMQQAAAGQKIRLTAVRAIIQWKSVSGNQASGAELTSCNSEIVSCLLTTVIQSAHTVLLVWHFFMVEPSIRKRPIK
jgi:hypothetical protein